MSEKRDFGFCPRCGALMQDGVCPSCGRGMGGGSGANSGQALAPGQLPPQTFQNQGSYQNQGPNYQGYPRYQQICVDPPKKGNKKGLWFAVTAAVVLILALIVAVLFYFYSIMKAGMEMDSGAIRLPDYGYDDGYNDDYNDDYYDDYYDDYGYYEPSPDDPYYETITDCTRTDLEYKVLWVTESIDPDDSEESCSYYCIYPILKDEEDVHRFDAVNAVIQKKAESYREEYGDYSGGASTYGYVTYMDEELVSIAFKHDLYEEIGRMPRLDAVTFHVDTGEEMRQEEMTEVDKELALRFRAQDKTQNGGAEYVQGLTDEELLEILRNPEQTVMFYSPVGLEIGFNYESGWVSVTMKERAL